MNTRPYRPGLRGAINEIVRLKAVIAAIEGVLADVDADQAMHNASRYHRENPEHRPCESFSRAQLAKRIRKITDEGATK